MNYVLAIDVGTSFTAAAVVRFQQGIKPVPECLPLGLRGSAVPSVVYYPEEGPILVGEAAERRGLDSPGRVVREFKRRIGDSVPIAVGTLSLPPEDVFATMARWVADRAAEREGEPPSEIILTHPAAWGSHRTSVVRDALAAHGLPNVTLLTEPEAAALHYASQVRVEDGSTVAVYDLGGGTFDTAVLRKAGSNRFEVLGRPEGIEDLGGADFDAAVFRFVAANTGETLAGLDTDDPNVLAALARLRRECVEAKEALSSDSEASISVLLPGHQQQVRLVRSEFEALIEEPVRDTVDALEQSLAQLELEPADLTAVLLIGGSSRIPLVAQLISEQLDRPIAVDADPKSSICLGAAVSAVLAQPEAAPAAAERDAEAAAADPAAEGGHMPVRPASWSRKGPAAGAAAAHGPGHVHHGGAHAPKPTVRLTAIAAAAAMLTVLTATAAQSPEGLNSLASVFQPGAEAAPEAKSDGGSGAGVGTGGAAAGAAGDAAEPLAGIEAGVKKPAPAQSAGLDVEASPTSRPSASATAEKSASSTGSAAGSEAGTSAAAAGTGSGAGSTTPGGTTEPTGTPTTGSGTNEPAPGTTEPTAPGTTTPPPVIVDPTPDPVPVEPTPEPTPVDPVPVEPTPEPTPVDPVPVEPTPEPTPVDPVPVEPTPSETVAPPPPSEPVPSEPATSTEPVA
ncbi:Hsp70 family protein [Arthrobacter nitrophenolicus]|uniref:Hsp70 family protein n=1 Tax=Arthrobacter nitrophenolicus TaxID=683150 RepID=A0A4R5Y1B4_9MICC|nr:Hsp70 family protein [Arthrobacter nitrophenolicus]TDL37237.1 Hsp70 family protein [Arthrobacter nitrophenolicus]